MKKEKTICGLELHKATNPHPNISQKEGMAMQEAQEDFKRENQDGWERMNKMEQMGIKRIGDYSNYE